MTEDLSKELSLLQECNTRLAEELSAVRSAFIQLKEGLAAAGTPDGNYQPIFFNLPVPSYSFNISPLKEYLLGLKSQYGLKLREYIENHADNAQEYISRTILTDVNRAALSLFKAKDRETLFSSFNRLLLPETWPLLVDLLIAITEGDNYFLGETNTINLEGKKFPIIIQAFLHSGDFDYTAALLCVVDISKQKDVEDEVKRSEERLRMILQAIPDLIFLFDREGFYLDFYASDQSKLAIAPDSIVGRHIRDIFPPQMVEVILASFQLALSTYEMRNLEYELDLPSGHSFFEARIVPAGPDQVIALCTDITERKLAALAVQKSEQHYRFLIESANDAIMIIDPQSEKILTANSKASEIYGFSLNELLAMSLKDLTKDVAKGNQQIINALTNKSFKNFETIHINKKGEEINMLSNGSVIDFDGQPAILLINHDITDLKRAEMVKNATYRISELALTTQSLDELYKSIHAIISELLPAKNIYIALYDQDINMLSFPYFVDEHDTQPATRKLKKGLTEYVLRTGKPVLTNPSLMSHLVAKGEIEIIGTLTYDWLGVPLKTRDIIIGVLVVQSYKKSVSYTEGDKEILIFVSEQIAMAIDRKIKEEELLKAKETAEESSKLKSTLLANLSHEFRTPMNGILNYAKLLKDNLGNDPKAEMAETIFVSGNRLLSTLDSIMYLAQIEASNIKLDIKKNDIGNEIESVVQHFETEATEKGLSFEYKLEPGFFSYCDITLINQITRYLLDNAIKFTPKGKITVSLHTTMLGGKNWVELEVKDTGIGISKQDLEVIFHEFRQLSSGYGRTHEGSGLGLTLCKKMAELMNGRILVDSVAGKGSSFYLRLPLAKDEVADRPQITKDLAGKSKKEPGKPVSIPVDKELLPDVLVVEDNQVNMELTVMFLRDVCKTDKARDGLTAIKMASSKHYSAILMDINLGPGMNGLEAAAEIRKIPGYEGIPIVAVTGYTMSGDREKMLQGGCTHYLPKPFDKKGIVRMVEEVLVKA
ncbi:MAG: ATP-binding protein [Bacteroidetes bacterium]|nr:ATP-binding protein [Bacteroidota bacterium]